MAQTKRPKKVLSVSPIGIAVWPWVTPGRPDTKYDKDGLSAVYRTKVAVDAADPKAIALRDRIDSAIEQLIAAKRAELGKPKAKVKVMDLPYSMETNDAGEETGRILFSFKQRAKGKTKEGEIYEKRVALFNANGTPLAKDKIIGGGSKIQVSYEFNDFFTSAAGVSLRMEAVRVLELVEYNGRDAKGYGFDTDDEYSNMEDEEVTTSTVSDEDDDEDEDEEF